MGSWGASLYDDDLAQDLQDDWRDLAQFGFNPPDILAYFLKESPEFSDHTDPDNTVFWLVMSDFLMKKKCLDENTRQYAIQIIDNGTDLDEWKNRDAADSTIKQRKKVLEKLRTKLLESEYRQPKPSKVYIEKTDLEIDDLCTYLHPSGYYVVLCVVGYYSKFGSHSPVFQILDWHQTTPPTTELAQTLPLRDELFKTHPTFSSSSCTVESFVKQRYDLLQKNGCLPSDLSFHTYFENQQYKYYPIIRESERSSNFKRFTKLGVQSRSVCKMIEDDIPTNGWRTWKNFNNVLADNYWQYRKMLIDKLGIKNEAFD